MHKERLLSATFEESKRVVSKKILTEGGAGIGVLSSMSFRERLSGLVILVVLFLFYAIGVGLPQFIQQDNQTVLSVSTITTIKIIGNFTQVATQGFIFLVGIAFILNIVPKGNYPLQLLYGNITIIFLIITFVLSILPFSIGLTVGAFGWLGFVLQFLVCVYLWKSLVLSNVAQLKEQLYKGAPAGKDWGDCLMVLIKKYGGILLLLSIVNRWTFNFGEVVKVRPDIFSFLYGWTFIVVAALMMFTLGMTLKNFVAAFYFFKYRKEYRQFFKVTNEQWYGKWRGKMMDKKKQKEK